MSGRPLAITHPERQQARRRRRIRLAQQRRLMMDAVLQENEQLRAMRETLRRRLVTLQLERQNVSDQEVPESPDGSA